MADTCNMLVVGVCLVNHDWLQLPLNRTVQGRSKSLVRSLGRVLLLTYCGCGKAGGISVELCRFKLTVERSWQSKGLGQDTKVIEVLFFAVHHNYKVNMRVAYVYLSSHCLNLALSLVAGLTTHRQSAT